MTDDYEILSSSDGRLVYRLPLLPEGGASPRVLQQNAKLRRDMLAAIAKREKGAPEWKPSPLPKFRAWPLRSPERIVELYGPDQVTYEEIPEASE